MKYCISTDKSKLDVEVIHDYLFYRSFWAKGRSMERFKRSIDNSICFGVYDYQDKMLGFARVITDNIVFAYLLDLFVFEQHRGKGLGAMLVKHIVEHPDLQVRVWLMAAKETHGLYRKFGFSPLPDPDRYMFKRDENYL